MEEFLDDVVLCSKSGPGTEVELGQRNGMGKDRGLESEFIRKGTSVIMTSGVEDRGWVIWRDCSSSLAEQMGRVQKL